MYHVSSHAPVFRVTSTCNSTAVGQVRGDPHFSTLDGYHYTFNNDGEYTLLDVKDKTDTPAAVMIANVNSIFMMSHATI